MYLVPCSFSRASSSQNWEHRKKNRKFKTAVFSVAFCTANLDLLRKTQLAHMSVAKDLSNPKAGIISAKSPSNILYTDSRFREIYILLSMWPWKEMNMERTNWIGPETKTTPSRNMPPHITYFWVVFFDCIDIKPCVFQSQFAKCPGQYH